ncbi:MAG: EamA family transporter, partial [Clostridium sp.]|nr:EamA family transporter [Clostridium sp.]
TFYMCIRNKKLPTSKQMICVTMAMIGTFLIITKGNLNSLSISKHAVFWGIASAFASALYTLQPVKLIREYGSICTVGWGMLIGGIALSFINSPFNCSGSWSFKSASAIAFVVIFGTLIAFSCYLESLKYIEPYEASILGCVEPLSAALLSIMFLNVMFSGIQWLGSILIITTISVLSMMKGD